MNIKNEYQANMQLQETAEKQNAQWMQPARNAVRFRKQSLFSKLVTLILSFKWGN